MGRAVRVPAREELGGQSGTARLVAAELPPVLGKLLPQLADAACAHAELAGHVAGRVADRQGFGNPPIATAEAFEPVSKIDPEGHDVRYGGCACVFDDGFGPGVLFVVEVIEAFDGDALVNLAVKVLQESIPPKP